MRGPGSWRKKNVNRVWECPACHRRERTGGHFVNRRCVCSDGPWMHLIEDKQPPAAPPAAPEINPQPVGAPAGEAEPGSALPRVAD
jgi:hypothetical protein